MRLIDADALDKRIYNDIPIKVFGSIKNMAAVRQIVEDAPTVCKWHDHDEELPKKAGEYLCLSPLANGEWRTDIYRWNGRHFEWTHPKYGKGLITGMYWWMEIPQMPKDGDNDAHERTREADMQEI